MLIILFCAVLVVVGLLWRRAASNSAGYFLANRQLAWWQAGLAMAATAFGSSAILVASQMAFAKGLAGIWFALAVALGFLVMGFCFAARVRGTGAHSLADYIGMNFGGGARWLAAVLIVVVELGWFGLTVKSFALLARPLLPVALAGVPDIWLQVGITAVFLSYTLVGGHKADVMADIGKLALVGSALLFILLPVVLYKTPWGALPAGHWSFPFNAGAGGGPVFVLNMLVLMGLPSVIGGDVFSKTLSARDAGAAKKAMVLAGGVRAVLALVVVMFGLAARALLPALANPQQAVPALAHALLPPGLSEVVALALLAALLSTSDAVLITTTTVVTLDVLRLGEAAPIWIARVMTVVVAVAGFCLAVGFGGLLEILRFSYTLLAAGISAPVIVALLSRKKKVDGGWFIAAMVAGVVGALVWHVEFAKAAIDPAVVGATAGAGCMLLGVMMSSGRLDA